MGLRCTHLVSTKRPDTRAFFGLRPLRTDSTDSLEQREDGDSAGRQENADDGEEWEQWPDELLGSKPVDSIPSAREDACDTSPYRHHGKEIVPNPKKNRSPTPEEEWWDCPICRRPQPADERQFNGHIDLCLSRQAIRDTVQLDAAKDVSRDRGVTPESKRAKPGSEKKRGRPTTGVDPKQKKLCFG